MPKATTSKPLSFGDAVSALNEGKAIRAADWPEGRYVIYCTANRKMRLVETKGGKTRQSTWAPTHAEMFAQNYEITAAPETKAPEP